jgi:hypothetical protein
MFSAPATGLAEFSNSEAKRLSAKANAKRADLETTFGELDREIDRRVDAITTGQGTLQCSAPRSKLRRHLKLAGPPQGGFSFEAIPRIMQHGKNKSNLQGG